MIISSPSPQSSPVKGEEEIERILKASFAVNGFGGIPARDFGVFQDNDLHQSAQF
jgi:hypothetical protein